MQEKPQTEHFKVLDSWRGICALLVAGRNIDIEVDGGVTPDTVTKIAAAGANAFVAGSAVFKGGDYKGNIAAIRKAAATARGEMA